MTQLPNIILIMTDQQRFDTLAAWGYDHMVTPNMDRLVANGLSFRQAYCPGATCIASRAAIFTGMYAHNTGTYSFHRWAHQRNWVQNLADAGYFCANIGKMHFSPRDVAGGFHERVIVENPTNMDRANGGSDDDWGRYLSLHGLERPNGRNQSDPDWLQKFQGVPWHYAERFHSDVFIGQSAVAWIENFQGNGPFFLEVGLTGPHEPWDPLPRHLDLYANKPLPGAVLREGELGDKPPQHLGQQHWHATTHHESQIDLRDASEADIAHMRRHYYAKITTVDEQIGRVLDALAARGWLEDSLIIFCSDHGELLGDHGLAYKWLMYDPIVHIPLIIQYPGTPQGWSTDDLVSLIDLGPTILEAAGLPVPAYFEGRSLMPYLRDEAEATEPRQYVYCEDNYQIMQRSATHKLVYYIGQEAGELYDLLADPHELWNLWAVNEHAALKNDLLQQLLKWLASSTYFNAGYKQQVGPNYGLRWPGENAKLHGPDGNTSRPLAKDDPLL